MSQSVRNSALEVVTNVVAGFVVAVALQAGLHTLFAIRSTGGQQVTIALLFTLSSLLRSFALRRLFERLGR
ncbi:DUF7220 family protein [Wenxinia marina]|uniref:Uncharacterized protein n=1 Tax=Wenxinia marina DSM 24838 TaxID=1123501 RepID=A0A0D0NMA9_9RHOB|nr:hypothetical protein [Wenxinia marina]KIQ69445.1 hypothetical protein Wenmar_01807 [Wenxinia marina DSM 24838]GGL58418.1 hypothetical protein GCM10011392_11080 [Wenxinia marina]